MKLLFLAVVFTFLFNAPCGIHGYTPNPMDGYTSNPWKGVNPPRLFPFHPETRIHSPELKQYHNARDYDSAGSLYDAATGNLPPIFNSIFWGSTPTSRDASNTNIVHPGGFNDLNHFNCGMPGGPCFGKDPDDWKTLWYENWRKGHNKLKSDFDFDFTQDNGGWYGSPPETFFGLQDISVFPQHKQSVVYEMDMD